MPRRKTDKKAVAIIILSAVVLIQTFFLLAYKSKELAALKSQKKAAAQEKSPVKKSAITPKKASPEKSVAVAKTPPVSQGKIAVIIDDCGYNLQPCAYSAAIKSPVAFSVLPNLRHSTDVADCVYKNRQTVMLHLPMEPHYNPDHYPDDYIITTAMSKSKVERIIEDNLENVPHTQGVNNHMGSKATESMPLMTTIFAKLKNHGLFFIDSLVTDKSVCASLAKTMKLSFSERDVFLDNVNERAYIEGQFEELARIAKKNGYAIAIGHDRELTLDILKEQTELLERQGFQFVTPRELLSK